MFRVLCVSLVFISISAFSVYASTCDDISAQSAVVMVQQTGEVLFAKNEHQKRGIASTTKIMTALLTLECAAPDKQITVSRDMVTVEGTSMGLLPGDKVTYYDLVYGMLLASGNDAANAAAVSIGGSLAEFSEMMNTRARQLGMNNTNFVTPSGLDSDNHYSTAYDMALLGCEALDNPAFLSACSSQRAELCYGKEAFTRVLTNHNRLLSEFDGAIGIKTGFTKKSGRCLVSAAVRDGVTLVCVTLCAPDDWNDHKKLLGYGFSVIEKTDIALSPVSINVFGGDKDKISCRACESLMLYSSHDYSYTVRTFIKPYLFAPVNNGDVVGEVRIVHDGKTVESFDLIAAENSNCVTIEKKSNEFFKNLFNRIKQFFYKIRERQKDYARQ